jgi:hypothetical protein
MEMIRHHHEFTRHNIIPDFAAPLPFLGNDLYGRHACRPYAKWIPFRRNNELPVGTKRDEI